MFRTQTNQFDEVVAKATDETLTSENWEYMMDAWERVNNGGENGPKDAVAALIKRLAHRNANVQLYTLELANAFTQNCGRNIHREMASRAFTDALLRLAGDRNTHAAVKTKVLEKMAEWTEMFKSDPGLGLVEQAYNKAKSANPNLHPPSKPTKREITEIDRQKEEEELQMALEISLKEKSSAAQAPKPAQSQLVGSGPLPTQMATQSQPATAAPHTTAATVSRVRALYDFVPSETGELAFRKGDIIAVLESVYKDWWKGSLRGMTGIFPLNYVEKLSDPTVEELQKDAQMEAEVFGQIKNVEKLLSMLSTSDGNSSVQDNDQITTLYHTTLAIRPKLIELIGKYSQKKDDFVALNEKFIKARRDYEALLETSMSGTAAAQYGRPPVGPTTYSYPPDSGHSADPGRYAQPQTGAPSGQYSVEAPAGQRPIQAGAGRYYTSRPHNHSVSPQDSQSAYPPPQHEPGYGAPSNQYYTQPHGDHGPPAQNAAPPFYVVGQAAPGTQHQQHPQHPHHHGRTSVPPLEYPPTPQQQHHHPVTPASGPVHAETHLQQPQELATSIYDTPIDSNHEASFSAAPLKSDRPLSPPTSHPPSVPQTSSPPYPGTYQAYTHQPHQRPAQQQQNYAGPSPITPQAGTPVHHYPPLNNAHSPGAGNSTYQTYSAKPQSYYQHESAAPKPAAQEELTEPPRPSEPQDYYRQSELFLPPGSRAQG